MTRCHVTDACVYARDRVRVGMNGLLYLESSLDRVRERTYVRTRSGVTGYLGGSRVGARALLV